MENEVLLALAKKLEREADSELFQPETLDERAENYGFKKGLKYSAKKIRELVGFLG